MRPLLALCALLLATPALAQSRQPLAVPDGSRVQYPGDAEVQELERLIRDLEGLADASGHPAIARELRRKLAAIRADVRGLDDARWLIIDEAAALEQELMRCNRDARRRDDRPPVVIIQPAPPPPAPPPPVEAEAPVPISEADFGRVLRTVQSQSFSSDQLATLRSAARSRWFTVGQVVRLLEVFSFDKDKVEAAALLHEAVVDPQEWYRVYDALTFSASKNDLRRRVGD
jgi:hypothetical protein